MNNKIWLVIGFIVLLVLTCLVAGGAALFFGPTFGGVGAAIAPDFHFDLVSDWVCPEGSEFTFEQIQYSYNEPGESTIEASCVSENGVEKRGQELKAIGLIMLVYSLVCFSPLFLFGLIISAAGVLLLARLIQTNENRGEIQ